MRRAAAEDAVQEAGARAIARDVPFTDADDLLRWIQTVAWRVVLDTHRHDRRLVYDVPDARSSEDVGRAVEQRLRLERLGVLLGTLTQEEHATLTSEAPDSDRRSAVRVAVRRHRLRIRLLAMLDGAAAIALVLRRLATVERGHRTAVVAPALAAASVLLTFSFVLDGQRPPVETDDVVAPPAVFRTPSAPVSTGPVGHVAGGVARPSVAAPRANKPADFELHYPSPAEGDGGVTVRPKQPDDHFVCLDLNAAPGRCADLPIRITD